MVRSTDLWEVEHECKRPKASGLIYDPEKVQAAVIGLDEVDRTVGTVRRAVGIDWGRFAVAVLAERGTDHVAITEARIFDSRPISDLVAYLVELRARVGDFVVYADAENAYGNLDCRNAGFEVVPVAFNKFKDEGIENVARYFAQGRIRLADTPPIQTIVRQLLRYHRNEQGRIVKEDDHGPDALMCAMLHFPFVDEWESAISAMLSGTDRERLKLTNKLLDRCISEQPLILGKRMTSMGVSVGAGVFYVVISTLPDRWNSDPRRWAAYAGRVKSFEELTTLMRNYRVERCVISAQPEPHLVQSWARERHYGRIFKVVYTNDGFSKPEWDRPECLVRVDRTFALNSAYEEIAAKNWVLPPDAREIDGGELYAQLKAPTRVRDLTTGELRYRWTETGALDHYRHAHAFDHLAGFYRYGVPGGRVL